MVDYFPIDLWRDNVALMARYLRTMPEMDLMRRVQELADLTKLPSAALDRFPTQISGGHGANAWPLMAGLVLDPPLTWSLLDEPMGALDPLVRYDLQADLQSIFVSLKKTVVLVTHDMGEAGFFGDDVILMAGGRIAHRGAIEDFYERPADDFVILFITAQLRPRFFERHRRDPPGHYSLFFSVDPCAVPPISRADDAVHIGSKAFTESVILGEMLTSIASCKQIQGDRPFRVKHMAELGGTQILWKSLLNGEIDAYVEYSGTLQHEILTQRNLETLSQIVTAIGKDGIKSTAPLGFNNTYALGMRKARDRVEDQVDIGPCDTSRIGIWFLGRIRGTQRRLERYSRSVTRCRNSMSVGSTTAWPIAAWTKVPST